MSEKWGGVGKQERAGLQTVTRAKTRSSISQMVSEKNSFPCFLYGGRGFVYMEG